PLRGSLPIRTDPRFRTGRARIALDESADLADGIRYRGHGGAVIALAFLAMFVVDAAGYWALAALEDAFGVLWSLDFPAGRTALFSSSAPRGWRRPCRSRRCRCRLRRW